MPSTPQIKSKLLAALDGDDEVTLLGVTPVVGKKRSSEALDNDGSEIPSPFQNSSSQSGKKRKVSARKTLEVASKAEEDLQLLSQLISQAPSSSTPRGAGFGIGATSQFGLRYDAESEVHAIDVGGADQDLRLAEFVTRTIDNASHGISVANAMEYLGLQSKTDLLPGLEVRLLPHQMIGVSWMLKQERNSPSRGGVLADDMGLGKTVQMIATMAMNQPGENEKNRTTLVVVPAALLLQWKEEIDSKTNGIFDVWIHHGKDKLKSTKAIQEYDVIVTTYNTLWMDFTTPSDLESEDEDEWLIQNGGVLARTRWYRVITDEAQIIRNRATRSSKAVARIRAKYRWCLTGTPVTNTLADIYGLLRFGHFRPWNDWPDFNEYIAKVQLHDAPLAGMRAQEVLKPLLLRRTKNSELEGRPLLELPPKHVELVRVEFSEDERQIYQSFERRAQININKFLKNNSVVKNHSVVLLMILRLRQLCCHPQLILSQTEGFEDPTLVVASDTEKEFARAMKVMGTKWASDIKQQFLERARTSKYSFEESGPEADHTCPNCDDLYENDKARVLACGHQICFDCLLDLSNSAIGHNGIFGYGDEKTNAQAEKEFENAAAKGLRPCPTCKKMQNFQATHTFKASAFEPTEEEFNDAKNRAKARRKPIQRRTVTPMPEKERKVTKSIEDLDLSSASSDDDDEELLDSLATVLKKHKAQTAALSQANAKRKVTIKKNAIVSDDEDSDEKTKTPPKKATLGGNRNDQPSDSTIAIWRKGNDDMEPSAKMLHLIDSIKEAEPSGDKLICFSQWTSMLDLVEILFTRYGIQSLRYDGKMTREARESVLARFRKSGGPRVILISTKCGGVGLNLVSANRIVNLDLSWNYATESQAYDRVHRLGQEKEVHIKRLVIRDSIEDRMLQLQETKTGLSDAALGEGGGIKLHKLSVKELKALFGMSNNNNNAPNGSQ